MSYTTDNFDKTIVGLLQDGAVGFMPTDTIYGLSCQALNKSAVERVRALKQKKSSSPLIVLISDTEMLKLLGIDSVEAEPAFKYWPGALSVELRSPAGPDWLHRGYHHFALRLPGNLALRELIAVTGPLVSTSANIHGQPAATSLSEARAIFGDALDFYVDSGKLDNQPSTLAILKNGKFKIERQGAVKIDKKEITK